jgi:ergothioneine biosynthesis protein EgtC
MCRLLGYLGQPIFLENLLEKPSHSLIVQSYQPKEMTAGILNADGFGLGWHRDRSAGLVETEAFTYKNTLPIWNDPNLSSLCRYIESPSVLANVRSATPGLPVDLSNCQPFQYGRILYLHNGFIQNFRSTLARPIRDLLADRFYHGIVGNTDSEHIFALFLHYYYRLDEHPENSQARYLAAIQTTLAELKKLALEHNVTASLNLIIGDGSQLVAARFAVGAIAPSLYWQWNAKQQSILIVSEPLDSHSRWQPIAESSLLWTAKPELQPQIYELNL